jgi:hypothetical protein
MKRFLRRLDQFWFPEAPAARLAVLRILVGGFAFCLVAANYTMWGHIGHTSPALFAPVGVVGLLDHPLAPWLNQGLIVATLVASVFFILGWRYRVTGPAFAVLLLWTISYRLSWSMIYHSMHLVVLHVLILGLAPAADALSLDARRATAAATARNPAGAWEYGFPIRLICAVTVFAYFVTGMAKAAGPLGSSWVVGEALRSQVAADAIRKEMLGETGSPLFYLLYHLTWLFTVIGVMSFALELGAPFALLNRRLGQGWAVGAFFMHWGILLIMGINFRYHLSGILYASFFDVEYLAAWLAVLWTRVANRPVPMRPATS